MFRQQKTIKIRTLLFWLLSPLMANASANNIAVQMYTLRDVGSLNEQFAMAHDAGFKSVELVGDHGVDSDVMNRLLGQYSLNVMAAHVQIAELRQNLKTVIDFNKAIHNKVIIMPWLNPDERPDSATGWQALGNELNQIGQKLQQHDMLLAYHNHDFEMKKYQGKLALEWLLSSSKAANLSVELDAAWVSRGGQDPVELIKKLNSRIFSLHVKDNAAVGTHDNERNFTVAGDGIMSWNDVLSAARNINVKWYVVEHDLPSDPKTTITKAKHYLEKQFAKQ